jgi:3-hydroxyisobutyrate dehydrogenase-like beta-hydroxyacid dehydrogenase
MQVGFIGLGHMGKAIASNLMRGGHRLVVWNRSEGPVKELVALGAQAAARPRDAAHGDVLMSMLPDDETLRSVLLGQGVLEAGERGLIHVNLATVSIAFARELARLHRERGIGYVAAPVFGRPEVAREAKLNVVVAGESSSVSRVEPLLKAIAQKVWPVGSEPERANVVKLAGNFMIASAIETMGEAVALARAHGLGGGEFLKILTSTLFAAPVYQGYGQLIAEQRYEPALFRVSLGLKDVRLALHAAEAVHVPMPLASLLRDHLLEALACGDGDRDWAAVAQLSMRHAGLLGPPRNGSSTPSAP